MYVWVTSTVTETDVAVPESGTVMVSDMVLACVMASAGERVCVNCSVPVLCRFRPYCHDTKSAACPPRSRPR